MTPTREAGAYWKDWPEQGQWTYDDWLQLPDDGTRYEIIDGVLHMSPPFNRSSINIQISLRSYELSYR